MQRVSVPAGSRGRQRHKIKSLMALMLILCVSLSQVRGSECYDSEGGEESEHRQDSKFPTCWMLVQSKNTHNMTNDTFTLITMADKLAGSLERSRVVCLCKLMRLATG